MPVIFQTKTAKSAIGLSLSVDNSQSMTAADFIARRGEYCISGDDEFYLCCRFVGDIE